jgi:hypothetical protein
MSIRVLPVIISGVSVILFSLWLLFGELSALVGQTSQLSDNNCPEQTNAYYQTKLTEGESSNSQSESGDTAFINIFRPQRPAYQKR